MLKTTLIGLALSTGIFAAVVLIDIHNTGVSAQEAIQDNSPLVVIIPVATAIGLLAGLIELDSN